VGAALALMCRRVDLACVVCMADSCLAGHSCARCGGFLLRLCKTTPCCTAYLLPLCLLLLQHGGHAAHCGELCHWHAQPA
jgi:hypothetical protein